MSNKENFQKRIVESLDGNNPELLRFLPYILQDSWSLGADPIAMTNIYSRNIGQQNPEVLDLGCGKGAVSIAFALEFGARVNGLDAIPEFIDDARRIASDCGVAHLCNFQVGDVMQCIDQFKGMDLVILGAVGPILGDLHTTLGILRKVLKPGGHVLLDDGFIQDHENTSYNRCLRKTEFYNHIQQAGFSIVEEDIFNKSQMDSEEDKLFIPLSRRIDELIEKNPEKQQLLEGYRQSQIYEFGILKSIITTGTWLLKKEELGSFI